MENKEINKVYPMPFYSHIKDANNNNIVFASDGGMAFEFFSSQNTSKSRTDFIGFPNSFKKYCIQIINGINLHKAIFLNTQKLVYNYKEQVIYLYSTQDTKYTKPFIRMLGGISRESHSVLITAISREELANLIIKKLNESTSKVRKGF